MVTESLWCALSFSEGKVTGPALTIDVLWPTARFPQMIDRNLELYIKTNP